MLSVRHNCHTTLLGFFFGALDWGVNASLAFDAKLTSRWMQHFHREELMSRLSSDIEQGVLSVCSVKMFL